MPRGFAPTVFVSSTCYDFGPIRAELKDFLETLGLTPVMSEAIGFPITPEVDTVTNCVNAVRDKADIFILIVGDRYGSETPSGDSVTMLEYREAKSLRLPVYVFLLDKMNTLLRIWEKNVGVKLEGMVDNPKVFEFIKQLKHEDSRWVFEFSAAGDIKTQLRGCLGQLFSEALIARKRLADAVLPTTLQNIGPTALKLVLERPRLWEFKLFRQILMDQLKSLEELRLDLRYNVILGPVTFVKLRDLSDWILHRTRHVQNVALSSQRIYGGATKEAFGAPGQPGDPELIVYSARRMAAVCEEVYRWRKDVLSATTKRAGLRVLEMFAEFSSTIASTVEGLPKLFDENIQAAEAALDRNEKGVALNLEISIGSSVPADFASEMEKLTEWVITHREECDDESIEE